MGEKVKMFEWFSGEITVALYIVLGGYNPPTIDSVSTRMENSVLLVYVKVSLLRVPKIPPVCRHWDFICDRMHMTSVTKVPPYGDLVILLRNCVSSEIVQGFTGRWWMWVL